MKDPFWGEDVVLSEVRDAYIAQDGGKLPVIIGVNWDSAIKSILDKLKDMKVSGVSHTDEFVFAELTEPQVNEISRLKPVFKVWQDRPIQGLMKKSSATIKSAPAAQLFHADGKGITWAVLDTGIKEDHWYF